MCRAVFLDRDGTLCEDKVYLCDPRLIEPLPGVFPALKSLGEGGFLLVVVTNQSGVARGLIPPAALDEIHETLREIFLEHGVVIEAFFVCPHLAEGCVPEFSVPCSCRKPEPGLLLQASQALGIDLRRSFLVGDQLHDVAAGKRAGCRTILLNQGGKAAIPRDDREAAPDYEALTWEHAARWILAQEAT